MGKYLVTMGDFLKNAGLVGLHYMLDMSDAESGKDYKGELSFFAVSETCRGKGLGRKLSETLVDDMRSQNIPDFYLFTDTSCNYPFYEHLGMIRRCEKKQSVKVNEERGDMTFFLSDYCC